MNHETRSRLLDGGGRFNRQHAADVIEARRRLDDAQWFDEAVTKTESPSQANAMIAWSLISFVIGVLFAWWLTS